jgi:3-hydroxypropanoate dehydrogenase
LSIDTTARAHLYDNARTQNGWLPKPVDDQLIVDAFNLARMGPTSANCEPMRLVLVKSEAGKEKLLATVSSGNYEKTKAAPVTAIVAYDSMFYEELPKLFPHADARSWFTSSPELAQTTAFRNGTLQAGYFILALRAVGLESGGMSGFDNAKLDAAFFPDGRYKSNFLLNIGYGDPSKVFGRLPRFEFDDVAKWA